MKEENFPCSKFSLKELEQGLPLRQFVKEVSYPSHWVFRSERKRRHSAPAGGYTAPIALPTKSMPLSPRFSGRLKIAQRFIAGIGRPSETKSVKRTAERIRGSDGCPSAGRSADYKYSSSFSQQ